MSCVPSFEAIEDEISTILDLSDEELTEEEKEKVDEYLAHLGRQEAEKIDGFCKFLRFEAQRVDALKAEADYLRKRAKSAEKKITYLKGLYANIMKDKELKKIQGKVYSLSLRKSESVFVNDESIDTLDEKYVRITISKEPNKTAIKEALKNGEKISGCCLYEKYNVIIK